MITNYLAVLSETLLAAAPPLTLLPDSRYQRAHSQREKIIDLALRRLNGSQKRVFQLRYANGSVPGIVQVGQTIKKTPEQVCEIEGRALNTVASIPRVKETLDLIAS